ncbi:MAG: hypothetical protein WC942_09880 [Clostridia bacterium]
MNVEAFQWARKYYDSIVECVDLYQTSKLKAYREKAYEHGAFTDENAKAWLYKADLYLIKYREQILDNLDEFFGWEPEKCIPIEEYIYSIKTPLQHK